MVADAILNILGGFVRWFLGLLPVIEVPSSAYGLPSAASDLSSTIPNLPIDTWISVSALLGALGFVLLGFAAAAAIRIVRMGVSHVTGGGGAT